MEREKRVESTCERGAIESSDVERDLYTVENVVYPKPVRRRGYMNKSSNFLTSLAFQRCDRLK